ncbi:LsmAD domain-containing protein [Daedaleopsis nitida]|nr:LsmAD domain-containing protein [Daedaleopsis nitida]
MATTARQSKPPRKGPEPARRPAWTGPRASPTFSPGPANARLPNGNQQGPSSAFPPLANGAPRPNSASADPTHARILAQISGLTGTTVTISTKTNMRFEGVVLSTNAEGDTTGVTLKDVKEVTNPGAPLRETFFIAATNIHEWSSGPADAKIPNGADSFKTDTDISKTGARRERELQAWNPDASDSNASAPSTGAASTRSVDELTFGPGASGGAWDQFAVNEQLFGVKANFDEDAYTTKLDRNAPDFKEKERKAAQIASEIMNSTTSNVHIAEERVMNLTTDGSGTNEEDKYGAVVRSANAYVPPGARKTGSVTTPPAKSDIPKVAVNGPDGSAVVVAPSATTLSTPSASKVPSPAPSNSSGAKQPADAVPAFRNFVSTEKDRLLKKKQALMKSEMDKRLSDLVSFSKSFKLNKPIPEDLVPILAKDEDKQRLIKEKSTRDAEDTRARSIGVSSTIAAAPGARPTAPKGGAETTRAAAAKAAAASGTGSAMQKTTTAPSKPGDAGKKIAMFIQPIPPFNGKRATTGTSPAPTSQAAAPAATNGAVKPAATPLSPTAQNRLNVNASSFRPNVKASAFSPSGSPNPNGSAAPSAPASSNGKQSENASPQGPPNPFFGTRVIKKAPPVHVKDDFNPFKHHKVIEAAQVGACCSLDYRSNTTCVY